MKTDEIVTIGQEAICPDGIGRVQLYNFEFPQHWVKVATYVNNRSCKWDACNVELINPRGTVLLEDKVSYPKCSGKRN